VENYNHVRWYENRYSRYRATFVPFFAFQEIY